jgi:hypothetical protein
MAQDFGLTALDSDITSRDIFASKAEALRKTEITIASGQDLKRGTLLGKKTANDEYCKYNSGASDGTENLAGVLGMDIDASESDEKAFAYITGEFNKSALDAYATSMVVAGEYFNSAVNLRIIEEE